MTVDTVVIGVSANLTKALPAPWVQGAHQPVHQFNRDSLRRTEQTRFSGDSYAKTCRILFGCMLASLCLLPGSAGAQVVTEFSAGISAFAQPLLITAGPLLDGNLWFTEFDGNRIAQITTTGIVK